MSPAQRLVAGRVVPERAGYYVGCRLAEAATLDRGIAQALRLDARAITTIDETVSGAQTA
jgi:hypothetical protein